MDCGTPDFLSFTIPQSLLKFMSIESVVPSNHLILCHPLLLLLSIFPSIRVFSNESALRIIWPKYWNFSISPSNEYSGLCNGGGLNALLRIYKYQQALLWEFKFWTLTPTNFAVRETSSQEFNQKSSQIGNDPGRWQKLASLVECHLWWIILCVNLTRLKDSQVTDKILLLGAITPWWGCFWKRLAFKSQIK